MPIVVSSTHLASALTLRLSSILYSVSFLLEKKKNRSLFSFLALVYSWLMGRSDWSKLTNRIIYWVPERDREAEEEEEGKWRWVLFLDSLEELLFFFLFRINRSRGRTNLNTLILPVYMCLPFVEFVNDSLLMSRICQA